MSSYFDHPLRPTEFAAAGTPVHPVRRTPEVPYLCTGLPGAAPHIAPEGAAEDPFGIHAVGGRCEYELNGRCLMPGHPTLPYRTIHPACQQAAFARSDRERDARRGLTVVSKADIEAPDGDEPENTPTISDGNRSPGHPRGAEVRAYLVAYEGRHPFLTDMKLIALGKTRYDRLTDNQITAVSKFIDNEKARATSRPETGRDLTVLPFGRTRACVPNEDGGLTFLLIDRPADLDRWKQPSRWAGWVFVKQQQGPNEVRLGSQRPGQTYTGQWPTLIDKVIADPMAAVARYGLELGTCGICNRALTNAESRAAGIGPKCARRLAGEHVEGDDE